MEDKSPPTDHVEKMAHEGQLDLTKGEERRGSVVRDNVTEHELTFKDVARYHKRLIWWSFYFAMCAVGW